MVNISHIHKKKAHYQFYNLYLPHTSYRKPTTLTITQQTRQLYQSNFDMINSRECHGL